MSTAYEQEQMTLKAEAAALQQEIEAQSRQTEELERFIRTIRRYDELDHLTPYAARELIRAVDRAESVTVSALRIAVTVASALYNQKIVLEKVNAVNEATNKLIGATSKMLKEQGASIQQQAMETSVSIDTLKEAFADTFEALDAVSTYKSKALPQMRTTIEQFRTLADEGEKRILKMEA